MIDHAAIDPERTAAAFVVDIEGWEGPLDVLLALARDQKVDLRQLSITVLADQYLAFIAAAQRADLELAAEYLVMAAWLAYLKSRLLLPEPPQPDAPSASDMAAALTFQLQRLEAMREAGERLFKRPRLGVDVFARGAPERFETQAITVVDLSLEDLLRAYGRHLANRQPKVLRIVTSELSTVEAALARLRRALGRLPNWETLTSFLPPGTLEALNRGELTARSTLAATFVASLELAREGDLSLRQSEPFGAIRLGPGRGREDGR